MKPNEKSLPPKVKCKSGTCLQCALCKAVNYEEQRIVAPHVANGGKALYGAEVASYYFYFSAHINRPESPRTRQRHMVSFC